MKKEVDLRIDNILWWFDHIERMETSRIAKRIYEGKRMGNHSVAQPSNKWIDSVNGNRKVKKRLGMR